MSTLNSDLDLGKPGDEPQTPSARPSGPDPWIVGLFVLAIALGIGVFFWRDRFLQSEPAPPAEARTSTDANVPSETSPEAPLPSLEGSDSFVRQLARDLTSHPFLGLWLAGPDLVRNVSAVIDNIAQGVDPSPHLRTFAPRTPFAAIDRGRGSLLIDPRSYQRYDAAADAFASLNVERSAAVYRRFQPLLAAGYRELGHPKADVDDALRKAIGLLLATPVLEGDVALVQSAVMYEFADPKLESLAPAQKHLLRMGARNVQKIQAKLRELDRALSGARPEVPLPGGRVG